MTSQEVNTAIRQSLGLPAKPESIPTVPQEGHVCEFPFWSFSKQRVVYLSPADNGSVPLRCRLSGVNQPVGRSRIRFSASR
jgi:hypothetical protein